MVVFRRFLRLYLVFLGHEYFLIYFKKNLLVIFGMTLDAQPKVLRRYSAIILVTSNKLGVRHFVHTSVNIKAYLNIDIQCLN